MSKTISELPFTELVERARLIARALGDNDRARARGAVNDEYVRDLPMKEDWSFLISQSSIVCTPPYTTGVATINTQATAVTFSSDTVLDAIFTGRKIKFNDNANIYELTYSNATGGTIFPPLSGDKNIASGAFSIFQDTYALPNDFDRFPKNGGCQMWFGGRPKLIKESQSREKWYDEYNSAVSTPERCRVVQVGTGGTFSVQFGPPPNKAFVIPYDYVFKPLPLFETTAGFVDVSAGATAVTGSAGTTRFTEARTGFYFRVDGLGTNEDSEWYRIIGITNNSSLTLQSAFGLSGATTALYTISAVPQMPALMHNAILAGAVMRLMTDQNDPQYAVMASLKTATLIQARLLYKSRVYAQEIETVAEEFHYRR